MGRTAGLQQHSIAHQNLLPVENQRKNNPDCKQSQKDAAKEQIVISGPDQSGVNGDIKGAEQGDHHCGNDTAGQTHIVQRVTLVGIIGVGGQGRQNKAQQQPRSAGEQQSNR